MDSRKGIVDSYGAVGSILYASATNRKILRIRLAIWTVILWL